LADAFTPERHPVRPRAAIVGEWTVWCKCVCVALDGASQLVSSRRQNRRAASATGQGGGLAAVCSQMGVSGCMCRMCASAALCLCLGRAGQGSGAQHQLCEVAVCPVLHMQLEKGQKRMRNCMFCMVRGMLECKGCLTAGGIVRRGGGGV
jgi:hypothetical protein